jgi:arginyl-tRNA synthetase
VLRLFLANQQPFLTISSQTTKMNRGLSCTWHLQELFQASLKRIPRENLVSSTKLPYLYGIRRSLKPNADYQSSLAMVLGNQLREKPERIAQEILEHLDNSSALLKDAFVSKNGFMNFVLDDQWVAQQMVKIATQGVMPTPISDHSKSILVDFAAPNHGKKLHAGHLRSSVIGDTICNLLEFRGHRVSRVSHTGDVGAALATLVAELIDQKVPLDKLSDTTLAQYYESGKKRIAAKDYSFKQKVDVIVVQLQQIGSEKPIDPQVLATWQRACEVSRANYANIFERLRVKVDERGESTYLKLIPLLLEELQAKNLAIESRGAICIFVDGPEKTPMIVQKQNGGFLYATIDLAALKSRIYGFPGIDDTKYEEIIYVTDQSQQQHFQQLFKAAQLAGWLDHQVTLKHASFGLVLGKDGTKLSSRNGAFDYLIDLLDEATAECMRRSLTSDTSTNETNRLVGDAAVRYFELSQQRERNYKFAFDHVLHLKGNTGIYLLYACARLEGILRKISFSTTESKSWQFFLQDPQEAIETLKQDCRSWHPSERSLAFLVCQFDDEITASLTHLYPHYLCDYLYRLVSHFHGFYENCRVQNDPKEKSRLLLCAATHAVLTKGLQLVGIPSIQRM